MNITFLVWRGREFSSSAFSQKSREWEFQFQGAMHCRNSTGQEMAEAELAQNSEESSRREIAAQSWEDAPAE